MTPEQELHEFLQGLPAAENLEQWLLGWKERITRTVIAQQQEAYHEQLVHALERIEAEPHGVDCRGFQRAMLCDCHCAIAAAALRAAGQGEEAG